MEELKFPQRSEEWFSERLGKITGSKISDLMPSEKAKLKFTKAQEQNLIGIAAEFLTGEYVESYISKEMQWGIDMEDEARQLSSFILNKDFRECGIFTDRKYIGASPDGVSDKAVLEIKCPSSKKHLLYMLDNEAFLKEYKWQVYMEMLCTDKELAYLVSYDPRFTDEKKQVVIVEVKQDSVEMDKLKTRLVECCEILDGIIR